MSYCLSCLTHRPDDKSLPRPISLSLFHFSASHRPTSHRATSPIRILGGAPVDLTGWGSRPRFAVNDASTRNNRHQMVQRQMVQRQMSTGMLVGNIGRENPLASEKRACADEKRALRQEGGKIKPHRNRRACPDAVGVDKNHAEKLLSPLWRSRLLYGLSCANATGRGKQTDFFAIRPKRSHLAPAFPPAASRRDGGNGI